DLTRARNGSVRAERVFTRPQLIVAGARYPVDEDLLGLLQRHAHRVGDLAAVLPQIISALHGSGLGDLETQRLVPETQLLAHALEDVASRGFPEIATMNETIGVEGPRHCVARKCLAQKILPRHILCVDVGCE